MTDRDKLLKRIAKRERQLQMERNARQLDVNKVARLEAENRDLLKQKGALVRLNHELRAEKVRLEGENADLRRGQGNWRDVKAGQTIGNHTALVDGQLRGPTPHAGWLDEIYDFRTPEEREVDRKLQNLPPDVEVVYGNNGVMEFWKDGHLLLSLSDEQTKNIDGFEFKGSEPIKVKRSTPVERELRKLSKKITDAFVEGLKKGSTDGKL